jgi:hypothetical protein
MLAYLFWHRPRAGISREAYEPRLLAFHAALAEAAVTSASFWLEQLPFAPIDGYEDWYLVDDWSAVGTLSELAIQGVEGSRHETVAELSGESWGALYALVQGPPVAPAGVMWTAKPAGEGLESLLQRHAGETVWRRQLALGPAAELCVAQEASAARQRLWPS